MTCSLVIALRTGTLAVFSVIAFGACNAPQNDAGHNGVNVNPYDQPLVPDTSSTIRTQAWMDAVVARLNAHPLPVMRIDPTRFPWAKDMVDDSGMPIKGKYILGPAILVKSPVDMSSVRDAVKRSSYASDHDYLIDLRSREMGVGDFYRIPVQLSDGQLVGDFFVQHQRRNKKDTGIGGVVLRLAKTPSAPLVTSEEALGIVKSKVLDAEQVKAVGAIAITSVKPYYSVNDPNWLVRVTLKDGANQSFLVAMGTFATGEMAPVAPRGSLARVERFENSVHYTDLDAYYSRLSALVRRERQGGLVAQGERSTLVQNTLTVGFTLQEVK
jgi:hypothetical protein